MALDELARRAWNGVEAGERVESGCRPHPPSYAGVVTESGRTMRLFENPIRNAGEHAGRHVRVTVGLEPVESGGAGFAVRGAVPAERETPL